MRGNLGSERYCGNYITKEVHDLENEHYKCKLELCIDSGDDIPFVSLEVAREAGYNHCKYCVG